MSYTSINTFRPVSIQVQLNPGTQGSQEYHSQYQSGYDSVCILRYLSYKIQLNQELKVHTNTITNTIRIQLSLFSKCNSQSMSIFQESDSGPKETITRKQSCVFPTDVYFDFYVTD